MSVLKDFRFQVDLARRAERQVTLTVHGKPPLDVATPPEFRGGIAGVWSPEDLLVASVAACYAVTLDAIVERRSIPLRELEISGVGHVTKRADRRLGFVVVELAVRLTTDEGHEVEAELAARRAEEACLISKALAVPIEVELEVRTVPVAALAAA